MDWSTIITPVVVALIGFAGGLLGQVVGARREKRTKELERNTTLEAKKLEGDTTLEAKRLDDAAAIRKELREHTDKLTQQVGALQEEIAELYEQRRSSDKRIAHLEIALLRYTERMRECVEVINELLTAEEHLEAGHVKRARAMLRLVANDLAMAEQMELESRKADRIG